MSQQPDEASAGDVEQIVQESPLVVAVGDHAKARMLLALLDAAPRGLNVSSIIESAGLASRNVWYNHKDDLLDAGLVEVDEEASANAGPATIYRIADTEAATALQQLYDYTGAELRESRYETPSEQE